MALIVPNNGEGDALQYFVNRAAPQDLVLKLYQNNITPAETDTAGTYTEATFTGYAAVQLTAANWTVTPGAPTEAAYAQQTFTSSAGSQNENVYGYYIVQRVSGKLVWAERFSDGPYNIVNNGDAIKVTPKITGD